MLLKLLNLLIAGIIVLFSCGFTLVKENCGMRDKSSISLSAEKACCCSQEMHDRCCHQEHINFMKLNADQFCHNFYSIPQIEFSGLVNDFLSYPAGLAMASHFFTIEKADHPPPLLQSEDLSFLSYFRL